jgi:prolyl-tRNA synthetase
VCFNSLILILNFVISPAQLIFQRGIEVGQVFYLGTKYSDCFNAVVHNFVNKTVTLEMVGDLIIFDNSKYIFYEFQI